MKAQTNKTEEIICPVCKKPFLRWKIGVRHSRSIYARQSNSKTCSRTCGYEYAEERNKLLSKSKSKRISTIQEKKSK